MPSLRLELWRRIATAHMTPREWVRSGGAACRAFSGFSWEFYFVGTSGAAARTGADRSGLLATVPDVAWVAAWLQDTETLHLRNCNEVKCEYLAGSLRLNTWGC